MIYKADQTPVCPHKECGKPLEDDMDASAFVIPNTIDKWCYDECGWCNEHFRARRNKNGSIEFEAILGQG